ncbi:DUF3887 domain-containing protein [Arthrobacter russicus]|uniref:DUF3887 domain-containing protein n=1 Tax=Arthrobacter russicus TaxID=172040 RepID=A0ABU1JDR6_9MICC|nr:DUF3887 domain-containing protein [Arthrobacter russicus]MBQ1445466.1 DUF3887 domain-containing protein [Renibacterium sp.]MDN5668495.1 DUF3887 domain-containing protein [Renibacterium salmoninarum]MDR6270558.1 hypothetical protein [Arthrobacter russicus]
MNDIDPPPPVPKVQAAAAELQRLLDVSPFSLVAREALHTAERLQAEAEATLAYVVNSARESGSTWQDIGTVLGITRQAAFQRFGSPVHPVSGKKIPRLSNADAVKKTIEVFTRYAEGDWAAVRDEFSETMLETISERQLEEVWLIAVTSSGQFEKIDEVKARRAGAMQVVEAVLQFEAGNFAGRIAFGDAGRIQGLLVFDPEHTEQGRLPF